MVKLVQYPKRWTGLSTDDKPELADFPTIGAAAAIPDGSTFLELDTGNIYRWGTISADGAATRYGWTLDEIKVRAVQDAQTEALKDLVQLQKQGNKELVKIRVLLEHYTDQVAEDLVDEEELEASIPA